MINIETVSKFNFVICIIYITFMDDLYLMYDIFHY